MNVVIATGGSGGHIFPAIKVGLECQEKRYPCFFVGSLKFGIDRLEKYGLNYQNIQTCGFTGQKIFKAIYLSIKAVGVSFKIFDEFKPDVVIGFGGYSSFPVCLAARIRGIPLVIHEQNVVPGKANKMLSLFAQKVTLSFKKSISFFPKKKCIVTGCPSLVSPSVLTREEALDFFNFQADRYTILVFGGSQGSENINKTFLQALPELAPKIPIQVIHLLGKADSGAWDSIYKSEQVPAFVEAFLDQMEYAYKAADLVVARSGALTVTEVVSFQKAAIFIPYPYAGSHQKENAAVLSASQGAILMEDRALTSAALINAICNHYRRYEHRPEQVYTEAYHNNSAAEILEEAVALTAS